MYPSPNPHVPASKKGCDQLHAPKGPFWHGYLIDIYGFKGRALSGGRLELSHVENRGCSGSEVKKGRPRKKTGNR
jgi:hypothetical protein